jgi:hypothetical protein
MPLTFGSQTIAEVEYWVELLRCEYGSDFGLARRARYYRVFQGRMTTSPPPTEIPDPAIQRVASSHDVLDAATAYAAWLDAGQPASGLAGSGPYVTDRLQDAGFTDVIKAIHRAREAGLVAGAISRAVVPAGRTDLY